MQILSIINFPLSESVEEEIQQQCISDSEIGSELQSLVVNLLLVIVSRINPE